MKTRRQQKTEKNLRDARQVYDAKREEIRERLHAIYQLIDGHDLTDDGFKIVITWPHVGDLEHVNGLLSQVENFLNGYPDEQ